MPAFAFSVPLPNAAIRCERGFFFGVAVQGAVEKFALLSLALREANTRRTHRFNLAISPSGRADRRVVGQASV